MRLNVIDLLLPVYLLWPSFLLPGRVGGLQAVTVFRIGTVPLGLLWLSMLAAVHLNKQMIIGF